MLLLDEPLGPLDARLRLDLAARIHDVHVRRGLTTLHVTHYPDEALSYAGRPLLLEGGRIAAERSP